LYFHRCALLKTLLLPLRKRSVSNEIGKNAHSAPPLTGETQRELLRRDGLSKRFLPMTPLADQRMRLGEIEHAEARSPRKGRIFLAPARLNPRAAPDDPGDFKCELIPARLAFIAKVIGSARAALDEL